MITIENKAVYTTLAGLVNPEYAALIVVDMQNDDCKAAVIFDRLGMHPTMLPLYKFSMARRY